jgi:hypothetical protein
MPRPAGCWIGPRGPCLFSVDMRGWAKPHFRPIAESMFLIYRGPRRIQVFLDKRYKEVLKRVTR